MTRIADRLPQLLAEQRQDGAAVDVALAASNRALAAGDRVAAEFHGRRADELMARIRVRSRSMADLLDEAERRCVSAA